MKDITLMGNAMQKPRDICMQKSVRCAFPFLNMTHN